MKRKLLYAGLTVLGISVLPKACGMYWAERLATFDTNPQRREEKQAVLEGIKRGLGMPPSETGRGLGHFILKDRKGLQSIKLTVPREYISFKPNKPDGEID